MTWFPLGVIDAGAAAPPAGFALGNVTTGVFSSDTATPVVVSFSHNHNGNTLYVFAIGYDSGENATDANTTFSVTYNAVAMTSVGETQADFTDDIPRTECFRLSGAASGSNTVEATFSVNEPNAMQAAIVYAVSVISEDSVGNTAANTEDVSASSISATLDVTTADSILLSIPAWQGADVNITQGTGWTANTAVDSGASSNSDFAALLQTLEPTASGNQTVDATGSSADDCSIFGVEVRGSGPDVSVLNALADTGATGDTSNAGSFTVSAGTNRLLVCIQQMNGSTSLNPTFSYGGQAMTEQVEIVSDGGFPTRVRIYTLDEAGIAAASGTAFSLLDDVNGTYRSTAVALENVNQSTPVVDSGSGIHSGSAPAAVVLTTTAGGYAVAGIMHDQTATGNITWGADLTERVDVETSATGLTYSSADALTDGTDVTAAPSATETDRTQECQAAISFRKA